MINKKIFILSVLMLIVFSAGSVFAEKNYIKNFVTLLSGATNAVSTSSHAYSFVGQPVVFNTTESKDYVSKSAFGAALRTTQSEHISFKNNTSTETFKQISVPVEVDINTDKESRKIIKVRYKISQGGSGIWEDEQDFKGFTPGSSNFVKFSTSVIFSQGVSENYIQVYAQYEEGTEYGGSWSPAYTINLSSDLSPEEISFTSPDPLLNKAYSDPLVETTNYSIKATSVTITLKEKVSNKQLYFVHVSSDSEGDKYGLYNTTFGKISYQHSEFVKKYNQDHSADPAPLNLDINKEYTLLIKYFKDTDKTSTVDFVVIDGGVADILTYPSPFNPNKEKIKIRYLLGQKSKVTIRLYDKAGKLVCKLLDRADRDPGISTEEWDGKNFAGDTLATGAYIVEIIAKAEDGKEHRRYTALAIVGK